MSEPTSPNSSTSIKRRVAEKEKKMKRGKVGKEGKGEGGTTRDSWFGDVLRPTDQYDHDQ